MYIFAVILGFALLSPQAYAIGGEFSGFDLAAAYKSEVTSNLSGGIEQKTGFLGNLDLTGSADLDALIGATGLRMDVHLLGNHGSKPSEFVGDAQGSSNIEAPSTFKLFQFYLTQRFDEEFNASAGLIDLNADFYATETLAIFRNSSFGIGPSLAQTGVNGPSIFPTTSVALVGRYTENEDSPSGAKFGIFNATSGNPDKPYGTHVSWHNDNGYLVVAQADIGTTSVGVWGYTKKQPATDTSRSSSVNYGFYLMGEHRVSPKLSLALRYGIANPRVNQYVGSAEAGLNYKGLINPRPDDTFGLGVATAFAAPDYRKQKQLTTSETVLEATYEIAINENVTLTPDIQYIIHTGLSKTLKNAVVAALRLELQI